MKSRISTLFVLILFTSAVLAQEKYDKMINKAEATYDKGDYSGATKALNKSNKKISKKLGKQNQYTPTYYLLLAKYNLASGFLPDFESNLQTAISSSASINQETSLKHSLIFLSAAELNIQNGAYRIAKDYLSQSEKILTAGKLMTEEVKARWDMAMAAALTGQGFYNESLEILKARETYFVGRAVKQESFVDDKGALKSRRL
ncbi:MAG TPA: hypothetical protein VIT44_07235, partial [Cyclobacteriaceae bacterium]